MHSERQYQNTHIDQIVELVSTKRKICAQLPTGGGKTVEFSLIAKRYLENSKSNQSVFILVHREELMNQAIRTIQGITGIRPTLVTSKSKKFIVSRIYIGMEGSAISRMQLVHNVGLVILDECHQANFHKFHHVFLEELIIGFSATPISSSKKEPLNKYYHGIVVGPQIRELINWGYLSQNITRCPKDVVDATKFEIDNMKGDYKEAQMALEYSKPKHITNLVRNYAIYCKGTKSLVFNVNIEHSKMVTDCFVHCGHNARHLDAGSSSRPSIRDGFANEREEILDWYKITPDAILNNVMITTVGFDEPTTQNVFLNFSTLSLVKFLQTGGRGGRIIDLFFIESRGHEYPYELEEKSHFNIIDMGGNCIRFGDWNDDRDWKYIFDNPGRPMDGVAPVKTCPECEGLLPASARVCSLLNARKELCLHEFEKKQTKEEGEVGEMILITKGINVDELINKNKKKYDYYTFGEIAEKVVSNLLEQHEKPSSSKIHRTFETYYKMCSDWYKKALAGKDGNMEDISTSAWHIQFARGVFDRFLKTKQLALPLEEEQFCQLCEASTDMMCNRCGDPVCEDCTVPFTIHNQLTETVCKRCDPSDRN